MTIKLKFIRSSLLVVVLGVMASFSLNNALVARNFKEESISEVNLNLDPQMLLGIFDQLKSKFNLDKQGIAQKLMQFQGALDQAVSEEHFSSKINIDKFDDASREFMPYTRDLLVSFMNMIFRSAKLKVLTDKADSTKGVLVVSDAEVIPVQIVPAFMGWKGQAVIVGQLGNKHYVIVSHPDFEKLYTALLDAEVGRYLEHFKDGIVKFFSKITSNMKLNQ